MFIKKFAALFFLSVLPVFAFDLELPSDERGLLTLLEEQLIDTLQYEQLLVYYALPLCVPQGELALIAELFQFLKDFIPDKEQLEAYHPFDNRQIQKFFSDFPYLAGFEPVFRFNVSSSERSSNGEIVFGINKSKIGELEGQRLRFRSKSARFSMDGSIVLNDSGAMFRSRRAAGYAGGVNVELGNFKQPLPGELFFGNFSPLTDENESVKSNWLYGSVRGWNGAAARTDRFAAGNMFGFSAGAFYHVRPTESGAGAGLDIYALRGLKIHAGFTAFKTNSAGSQTAADSVSHSIHTAHLYAEYKDKVWGAVFETGFPLEQESFALPLSFRLNYRTKGSSAQYHLLSYPSEFNAQISRLRKQILSEIGEKEYYSQVRKHSLKMTVPFWGGTKLIPEIDFTESGAAVKRVYGRTQLKARTEMVDFTIKHSTKIFTLENDSVFHTSGASVYLQTPYPLGVRAAGEYRCGAYKYERTSYSLDLQSSMLPNMIIVPFIRGKYSRLNNEMWFGLKHELHLYKKNWSSITVEIPYNVKGDENVYIRGSSSFTF
ncbi:MAG: hypothetical protein LBB56_04100 [Chitinispirillales bacterium]|nr:hypothetical protein [Chitinispirillales bacterium]